jgi:hypothetical protein
MYQAIYKCRLCGEEIKGNSGIYPSYYCNVPQMNVNNNIEYFPKTGIHDCKDGSMGVMDFQGFKKVGD